MIEEEYVTAEIVGADAAAKPEMLSVELVDAELEVLNDEDTEETEVAEEAE